MPPREFARGAEIMDYIKLTICLVVLFTPMVMSGTLMHIYSFHKDYVATKIYSIQIVVFGYCLTPGKKKNSVMLGQSTAS